MAKSALPDVIRNAKPRNCGPCAIHHIDRHYSVYKYVSTWDKARRKSVTQTGPCIGKTTNTGVFVPNERAPLQSPPPDKARVHGGFGACGMLCQIAPDVPDRLKKFFPDGFPAINALAVVRIVDAEPWPRDHVNSDRLPRFWSNSPTLEWQPPGARGSGESL